MIGQANYSEPLTNLLIDMRGPACRRMLGKWIPHVLTELELRCGRCRATVVVKGGVLRVVRVGVDSQVAAM